MAFERPDEEQLEKSRPANTPSFPEPASKDHHRIRRAVLIALAGVLLSIGLATTILGAYNAKLLAGAERTVTFALRGKALDSSRAQQVLDRGAHMADAPDFVLWEQRSLEYVENPLLQRRAKVNVVLSWGDVGLLVAGTYLSESDTTRGIGTGDGALSNTAIPVATTGGEGHDCIIDQTTALALFGDVEVAGLRVRYGEEDFTIAKVIQSARPLFLIRPTEDTGMAFSMLTASNTRTQPSSAVNESFTYRLGLDAQLVDYALLYHLAHLLCWLPTISLGMTYLIFLLRQGFSKSNSTRRQATFLLGFLASSVVLIAFIASKVQIPRDMIPSRFSDFALWQQILNDKSTMLGLLFDLPVYAPTGKLYDSFLAVIVTSVISLVLYLGVIWILSHVRFFACSPKHREKLSRLTIGRFTVPRLSALSFFRQRPVQLFPSLDNQRVEPED